MTRSVGSHVTANVILLLLAVTVVLGLYSTFLAHALWHDVDLLQERVSALEAITIDQANSIAGLTDNLAYLSGLAVPVAPSRLGPYSLGITSNGARMTLSLKGLDRVVFSWSLDGKATYWWVNDPYGNQYASSGVVYFSEGSAAFVVPVDGEYSIWFANADPPNKCMVTLYVTVYHSSALSAAGVS